METATVLFEKITLDWVKSEFLCLPEAPGIYQIYGTSPIYGMDTLLYIGKSTNLLKRVKAHFEMTKGVIGRQPNKSCRFALIDAHLLDLVEETLIVMHKPSFNSKSISNISSKAKEKKIYIQNHGNRGMLNIETTNFYFFHVDEGKEVLGEE